MDHSDLSTQEIERQALSIQPGDLAIEKTRPLSTLLGSCVAVCLFDPQAKVGGLNHFMLPNMRRGPNSDVDTLLSGAYAMESLLNTLCLRGAKKARLQAKAFGGGSIVRTTGQAFDIGRRNAEFAKEWLSREGIPLQASDFLGPWSRKVLFLPASGIAYCRRMATTEVISREEARYAASLLKKSNVTTPMVELF